MHLKYITKVHQNAELNVKYMQIASQEENIFIAPDEAAYREWYGHVTEFVNWIDSFYNAYYWDFDNAYHADGYNVGALLGWAQHIQHEMDTAAEATSAIAQRAGLEAVTGAIRALGLVEYEVEEDVTGSVISDACSTADIDSDGSQEDSIFHMELRI